MFVNLFYNGPFENIFNNMFDIEPEDHVMVSMTGMPTDEAAE